MRFSTLTALSVSALLQLVASQSLAGLPSCAVSCAVNAIGATGCATTDAKCICTATSFLAGVQTCISTACSAADQQATLVFAQQFCGSAGVTITLPTAAASSAAGPTFTSSAAPAPVPAATTSTYVPASYTSSAPPAATFTGAAAGLKQQWAGVAGLVGLGVAAML